MAVFRALSLDGGGMMGAFSASVLATYERECLARTGKGIVDHFDLITGTPTGGIIAVGLAMGASAGKILEQAPGLFLVCIIRAEAFRYRHLSVSNSPIYIW